MKEWFKYEFGYVNIDAENLYLTNSGNWSETKDLPEMVKKVMKKNDNKSSSTIGFLIVVIGLPSLLIFKNIISGKAGFTLILIALAGGYKLYEYLKSEIGSKFRIPLIKISEIIIQENNATINFLKGEGNKDSYKLFKIDEKGIKILGLLDFGKFQNTGD